MKNFICDLCKKKFKSEAGAIQHIKDFHPKAKRPALVGDLKKLQENKDNDSNDTSQAEIMINQHWN